MSMSKKKQSEDELDDDEAIHEIMEAFDVDEERARELWMRFLKTLDDLKKGSLTNKDE